MKDGTVYGIRRKSDGLFSTGGGHPSFTKAGKRWSTMGHLKQHLSVLNHNYTGYLGCELVSFKMVINEDEILSLSNVMETYLGERRDRAILRKLKWQREKTEAEVKKYEELKRQYGSE